MRIISSCCKFVCTGWRWFNNVFIFFTPFVDLFIRVYLAKIFFYSALTKIQSWDTTVFLFTYEYNVPLLPPQYAALSGTAVELVAPVLLVLGLFGRLPAFILFCFNIMAVYSYPFLFTEAGRMGLQDHWYWGLLLMLLMMYGPSKIALDNALCWLYGRCRG